MSCVITADNGTTSGSAGLKSAADSSGALSIKVGSGSVTAATFDASGNMGIGVTPSAWSGAKALDIGTNTALADISNNSVIYSNAYYNGSNTVYKQSSVPAGYYNQVSGTHVWATAASGTAGNTITWTTAMTLGAAGFLKVMGGASANYGDVANEMGNTQQDQFVLALKHGRNGNQLGLEVHYSASAPNGTGNQMLYCRDSVAVRAEIRSNGGLANYQANDVNLSDRREKTNFAPAKDYLNVLCQIPVQTFNYIDQNHEDDPGLTLGVVAQDVQAVAPELVMESNWGSKDEPKMRLSIYQTDFQYAMLKAIQELATENTELKQRIAALEAK